MRGDWERTKPRQRNWRTIYRSSLTTQRARTDKTIEKRQNRGLENMTFSGTKKELANPTPRRRGDSTISEQDGWGVLSRTSLHRMFLEEEIEEGRDYNFEVS